MQCVFIQGLPFVCWPCFTGTCTTARFTQWLRTRPDRLAEARNSDAVGASYMYMYMYMYMR
jgi:hypothetical protein